jgi:hypothetical protein
LEVGSNGKPLLVRDRGRASSTVFGSLLWIIDLEISTSLIPSLLSQTSVAASVIYTALNDTPL